MDKPIDPSRLTKPQIQLLRDAARGIGGRVYPFGSPGTRVSRRLEEAGLGRVLGMHTDFPSYFEINEAGREALKRAEEKE